MPNLPPSTAQTVKKLVKRYLRLVPRKVSKDFKAGVRAAVWLRYRGYVCGKAYKVGTPAFDAFRYGVAFAERIVESAFPRHGTPRSDVFKAGAAAILKWPVLCPHDPGTVEHDAFYAGVDAGKKIYCHTEER